jgi:hypothetical protein
MQYQVNQCASLAAIDNTGGEAGLVEEFVLWSYRLKAARLYDLVTVWLASALPGNTPTVTPQDHPVTSQLKGTFVRPGPR